MVCHAINGTQAKINLTDFWDQLHECYFFQGALNYVVNEYSNIAQKTTCTEAQN